MLSKSINRYFGTALRRWRKCTGATGHLGARRRPGPGVGTSTADSRRKGGGCRSGIGTGIEWRKSGGTLTGRGWCLGDEGSTCRRARGLDIGAIDACHKDPPIT